MIDKTDLLIYCDWLTDSNINSGWLRTIVSFINHGIIGVSRFGIDIHHSNTDHYWHGVGYDWYGYGCGEDGWHRIGDGDGCGSGDAGWEYDGGSDGDGYGDGNNIGDSAMFSGRHEFDDNGDGFGSGFDREGCDR